MQHSLSFLALISCSNQTWSFYSYLDLGSSENYKSIFFLASKEAFKDYIYLFNDSFSTFPYIFELSTIFFMNYSAFCLYYSHLPQISPSKLLICLLNTFSTESLSYFFYCSWACYNLIIVCILLSLTLSFSFSNPFFNSSNSKW